MDFDLSDEQKMLAEQARGLLAERTPYDHLRGLIDSGAEWDEPLWRELGEMGFLGALIPESFGGLGMSELDLGVISQELGRAGAAVPFCSSIVLAADAIARAGSAAQQAAWLPRLASGEVVACFASAEGPGPLLGKGLTFADGRSFSVAFRHAETAIEAEPVLGIPARADTDFYRLTLRFLEI